MDWRNEEMKRLVCLCKRKERQTETYLNWTENRLSGIPLLLLNVCLCVLHGEGGPDLHWRHWLALHGNLGQDCHECQWALPGNWWVIFDLVCQKRITSVWLLAQPTMCLLPFLWPAWTGLVRSRTVGLPTPSLITTMTSLDMNFWYTARTSCDFSSTTRFLLVSRIVQHIFKTSLFLYFYIVLILNDWFSLRVDALPFCLITVTYPKYFVFLMQQRRCQKQTPKTQRMQHDTGESTSRTQTPTPAELAVVGTRPPQPSPVFYPRHHHSPSTILSPSINQQGGPWCGEAQHPLTHLTLYSSSCSIRRKLNKTEYREERTSKQRWRRKSGFASGNYKKVKWRLRWRQGE